MTRWVGLCVVLLVIGACDAGDNDGRLEDPGAAQTLITSPPVRVSSSPGLPSQIPPQRGLPREVAEVRAGIARAAHSKDYDMLRPLLRPKVFLSDHGFGIDPIGRWEKRGDEPLGVMRALLSMGYAEEETNEGHLYRWPAYDAETKALEDISPRDRRAFLSVMSQADFRRLIPDEEYGYVGPRLGILADGTWWFFIMEPGP